MKKDPKKDNLLWTTFLGKIVSGRIIKKWVEDKVDVCEFELESMWKGYLFRTIPELIFTSKNNAINHQRNNLKGKIEQYKRELKDLEKSQKVKKEKRI